MDPIERYANDLLGRATKAAEAFRQFGQEQVDRIVEAVYRAAWDARVELARLAVEETGMGILEDKIIKNSYASLLVYEDIRTRKTVGVIGHDPALGVSEVAQPRGPVLATRKPAKSTAIPIKPVASSSRAYTRRG